MKLMINVFFMGRGGGGGGDFLFFFLVQSQPVQLAQAKNSDQ
jgi:hypothetical protein